MYLEIANYMYVGRNNSETLNVAKVCVNIHGFINPDAGKDEAVLASTVSEKYAIRLK